MLIEIAGLPEENHYFCRDFFSSWCQMKRFTSYMAVSIQFGNDAKEHCYSESLVQTRYSTGITD